MNELYNADLQVSAGTPELFVRESLRRFECDFREIALLALADWERLGLAAPELFRAQFAAVTRPKGRGLNRYARNPMNGVEFETVSVFMKRNG